MQVIVKVTTDCNLNCVYCSEGDRPSILLKKEYLFKLVDELPQVLSELNETEVEFLWHGGEPLSVGVEYLTEVMDYIKLKLASYKIKFLIQTNGTLIDDKWIDIFKYYDIGVGISLDGYKEIHDSNRRFKNNQPTFDIVMENIKKLKLANIPVGTLMVLNTSKYIDSKTLYQFIKDNQLNAKIHPVVPCGRAEDNPEIEEVYKNYIVLLKELYTLTMADMDETIVIQPMDEIMNAVLGLTTMRECSFNGTCGDKFICLFADGATGFCGRYEKNETFLYGHIEDDSLINLYHSISAKLVRNRQSYLIEHDCKNCEDWNYCHGGCTFEALNYSSKINSKYPLCKQRKELLTFFKNEGLELLRKRLVKEKQRYRMLIKERQSMLEGLTDEK